MCSWNLVFLSWMFLRVSVRKVVGCSSASPRSLRLREKAVGYFFGSGFAGLGERFCLSTAIFRVMQSPCTGRQGTLFSRARRGNCRRRRSRNDNPAHERPWVRPFKPSTGRTYSWCSTTWPRWGSTPCIRKHGRYPVKEGPSQGQADERGRHPLSDVEPPITRSH